MKKYLLLLTLISTNIMAATETTLTLYFIPSPVGMDWSSPANLGWSALKNRLSLKSRFMGHVFVELQNGNEKHLTGMVGKNFDYFNQLFNNKRGLGILFHSFDGQLEEKEHVEKEIELLAQEGSRLNFVRYKLNSDQYNRATLYLKEYRDNNYGRFYGLANRPLHTEGAGCSAFGASFLEVAGIMDDEIKASWSQTVRIPMDFAGPPLREEGANIVKLLFNASSWAHEKQAHKELTFWSPDRMFAWVKKQVGHSKMMIGKAEGIFIDKSIHRAPAGSIWQNTQDKK